jgi:uncharacterized 2Fe-2S/4Fe-4S cluster protein (DUF4445 family)
MIVRRKNIIKQNDHKFTINFQPVGRRVTTEPGLSLLNSAQDAGISIASICGGVGICDSCRIRLIDGNLSAPTLEEKSLFSVDDLHSGYRLACQSYPQSDLVIEIPPESLTAPQRLQIEGQSSIIDIDPPVIPLELNIPEPSTSDLRADTIRVKDSLAAKGITHPISFPSSVLDSMSIFLRSYNWHITMAMRKEEIVAALPAGSNLLGLAVDIGTTKLAAYLCDLQSGEILAKSGTMNPQTVFGEDVISRISYSDNNPNGRKLLQTRLIDTLNQVIDELCMAAGRKDQSISTDQIVEAVVVGNTAMHHLFAGLPVHQLGVAPYVPAVSEPLEIAAYYLGLKIARGAKIYLPSNIAGYVGADHVAMQLSIGISSAVKTSIAIDIGTNTEITLSYKNKLLSCSCASGPAFEGAHILAGMRAAPGAIERVQVIRGELRIQTIDNLPPIGICGSGILDAIACLLKLSVIDHRGSFIPDHPATRKNDGKVEFVLVDHHESGNGRDIVITRHDINEIQLAKGAIRTGIDVLLECVGISADLVEEFIIAGAFGSYINVPSAIQIGMFPILPLNRFQQVGNAAGSGARQMLLSLKQRHLAEEIAKRVNYVELSNYPNFINIFSKSLFL